MKIFKSHFWYNKRQRNGIFFLFLLIVVLQFIYVFIDFSSEKKDSLKELKAFQVKIDSLKGIAIKNKKPEIFPFNPNFISDFKGYTLGMSVKEIDRLHKFRSQNKYVNSAKEFQKITQVSDSLLAKISPYFKFPNWVINKKNANKIFNKARKVKIIASTTDINKATVEDFKTIYGVGEVLSKRIVKYRQKLQGFSIENQLYEVWGLDKETVGRILENFRVLEKPVLQKINVNTASFKEVLKNPYINYKLCKKIFEYRDEVAELQNIAELKKIEGFPLDKYQRIILYLEAK